MLTAPSARPWAISGTAQPDLMPSSAAFCTRKEKTWPDLPPPLLEQLPAIGSLLLRECPQRVQEFPLRTALLSPCASRGPVRATAGPWTQELSETPHRGGRFAADSQKWISADPSAQGATPPHYLLRVATAYGRALARRLPGRLALSRNFARSRQRWPPALRFA